MCGCKKYKWQDIHTYIYIYINEDFSFFVHLTVHSEFGSDNHTDSVGLVGVCISKSKLLNYTSNSWSV